MRALEAHAYKEKENMSLTRPGVECYAIQSRGCAPRRARVSVLRKPCMALNLYDLRGGADVADLVEALKLEGCCTATIDLRDNREPMLRLRRSTLHTARPPCVVQRILLSPS